MSKPGPRPTPTRVLKLRGSWRAKKRNDIIVTPGRPACPIWLKAEAKKEWIRIVPILQEMGILAKIDREMLALYCEAHARYLKISKYVARLKTEYIKAKNGRIYKHPAVTELNAAQKWLRQMASEFGMSASSRTGLGKVDAGKPDQTKAKFFKK
jgi:P27 family predicted phage terminase small subunit